MIITSAVQAVVQIPGENAQEVQGTVPDIEPSGKPGCHPFSVQKKFLPEGVKNQLGNVKDSKGK